MLLSSNGAPTGLRDDATSLSFTDGSWTDAADHWPAGFTPFETDEDGAVVIEGVERNTYDGGNMWLVNHVMATRPIGLTDNFEMHMRQDARLGLTLWTQTSPVVFGDIVNGSALELGLVAAFDISRPNGVAYYMHNAFAPPELSEVFNPALYDDVAGTANWTVPDPTSTQQWWTVRCVGGKMQYWFNGNRMCDPVDVPEWAVGRDAIGFHVVHFNVLEGELVPGLGLPAPYTWRSRIPQIHWSPYDTPLT